ncbi:MAG: hypothetical protein HPY61_00550 [Methanotrichaceae archaeon]|nr:hypothetical protein [Methanotrichaceae archaeon]
MTKLYCKADIDRSGRMYMTPFFRNIENGVHVREKYLQALKFGDEEKYADMVSVFAEIIREQRYEILQERLLKAVQAIKKTGQIRLTDFI